MSSKCMIFESLHVITLIFSYFIGFCIRFKFKLWLDHRYKKHADIIKRLL